MIRSLSRASLWVLMLILFAWAVAAEGQETTGTKSCTWDVSKAPSLFGFKLRMSQAEVIARFPDVPELATLWAETTHQTVKRGKDTTIVISAAKDGSKGMTILSPYSQTRIRPEQTAGAFNSMALRLDGRGLHAMHVRNWTSPKWKSHAEFVDHLSKTYGFSPSWWKKRPPAPWPEGVPRPKYPDFSVNFYDFTCPGFKVTSGCVGTPAPHGTCLLEMALGE